MEIVIPFAKIKALNPNLSSLHSADHSDEYYKCIVVSFMSFRKFNPNTKLVLATNVTPPTIYENWLKKLDVEIRKIAFEFVPPLEFGEKFKACFYIFDVINAATEDALYVDPDVFCIKDLNTLSGEMNHKIGVFELNFPRDYVINGLSIDQSTALWAKFKSSSHYNPGHHKHIGGEAIYIPSEKLVGINSKIAEVWNWNKQRAKEGKEFFTTEEHIISNLVESTERVLLNRFISRIWTARTFTEHQGNDSPIREVHLWHLPSEKNRGFKTMFEMLNGGIKIDEVDNDKFVKKAKKIFHIDAPFHKFNYYLKKFINRVLTN